MNTTPSKGAIFEKKVTSIGLLVLKRDARAIEALVFRSF